MTRTANFLGLIILMGVCGVVTVCAQEGTDRPVLDFDGNKVFTKLELLDVANTCLDRYVDATHPYETVQLDYCLQKVLSRMHERGYLQARLGKTLYEQTGNVSKGTVRVEEGPLFRVGEIKIENTTVLAPAQILDLIGLKSGEVADGTKLSAAIYERAKEAYGNLGYIQYTAEITPTFHVKEGADEGVADFTITIDEAAQYRIRSIKFSGGDNKTNEMLRRELMVRDGEVYSPDLFSKSITRMNNTGLYDRIDPNRDVEYQTNEKAALIDLTIRLKKKVASSANP
ncbi:MAG TPA: POTRA domain-containing protein [Pyrinomonadaceae bacterium]|jgi:outer membrane protein insertion porin family|nr:POTRA domain-containing protein [Pyrinomonadaceae bacterium]